MQRESCANVDSVELDARQASAAVAATLAQALASHLPQSPLPHLPRLQLETFGSA